MVNDFLPPAVSLHPMPVEKLFLRPLPVKRRPIRRGFYNGSRIVSPRRDEIFCRAVMETQKSVKAVAKFPARDNFLDSLWSCG